MISLGAKACEFYKVAGVGDKCHLGLSHYREEPLTKQGEHLFLLTSKYNARLFGVVLSRNL